ncbi:hypothetical protein M378DRAFT_11923 [Amanita muscaria Koide BX008]|uniref:Uncharacterized protein n=1 Tax=Amanita muscaria (strain Koide BX008) TaxID=946122 RepID=A0A0C2X3Q3_AMAMK|nr:hypothetical protein M378DRAFT_11923 [Amanita muscaria Koide BX008]
MPPKPVKRDSSATQGRYSPLSIPAFKPPSITCPTPVDVPPETPARAAETVKNVYKTYMTSLSSDVRAQSLYAVFTDLADELEGTEHFSQLIQRIADNLHSMGFTPSALQATPSVALPCALNHDPVTVTVTKEVIKEVLIPADPVTITVTKEVHPTSCETEMKKLRKELSDLKSGINNLYHAANHTHTTVDPLVSSPSPSPSPSAFDSSLGSNDGNNDSSIESVYDKTDTLSSVFSTPKVNHNPLPSSLPPKSFATALKTNVASAKSPKEIIRDRAAKSCTNKGTPSNVLVLSDFKTANTAESYKRIAEMRKNVNDILVDNKCKSISWSSRGNLVIKCAKPLSTRDKTDIINSAKATFGNDPTVLNKNTVSYVKFIDVPLFDIGGTPFDNNDFNIMIQQNEKWSEVNITNGPSIVIKKDTLNAKKATIKIGFNDDKHSTTAKRLLKTTILFGGTPIRCKPWTSVPPAPSRKRAPNASASSDAGFSSLA